MLKACRGAAAMTAGFLPRDGDKGLGIVVQRKDGRLIIC
jgi:hypothetical protein